MLICKLIRHKIEMILQQAYDKPYKDLDNFTVYKVFDTVSQCKRCANIFHQKTKFRTDKEGE